VIHKVSCSLGYRRLITCATPYNAVFDQAGLTARMFAVVIDRGTTVAQQYGLVHGFSPALRALYLQFGIDLAAHNQPSGWEPKGASPSGAEAVAALAIWLE